jgi:hypothetical protein
MDPHASIRISKERLELYSRYITEHGPRVRPRFRLSRSTRPPGMRSIALFVAMIVDRYEADIAFSFAHSMRRNISNEIWRPVAYSFPPASKRRAFSMAAVHRRLPVRGRIDAELVATALRIPGFSVPFRDLNDDSQRIVERLEHLFYGAPQAPAPIALDVVEAGFFADAARSSSADGCSPTTASCPSSWPCSTAPQESMPTRCCIGSPTSTICSAPRSPIFT